jgi:hypothetical protein
MPCLWILRREVRAPPTAPTSGGRAGHRGTRPGSRLRHDDYERRAGVVGPCPGRDYLIAVLTDENVSEQYGIDTVNGVSALVWSAFGT